MQPHRPTAANPLVPEVQVPSPAHGLRSSMPVYCEEYDKSRGSARLALFFVALFVVGLVAWGSL